MNATRPTPGLRGPLLLALLAALNGGAFLPLHAENAAVATRVFNGYTRTRLADGSFKPETYAFADGGHWDTVAGDSANEIPFRQLAGTLAIPMRQRGYVSAQDPEKTDLLIFVFWGSTRGTKDEPDSPVYQNLKEASQANLAVRSEVAEVQMAVAQQNEAYFKMWELDQRMKNRTDVKNAMLLGFQDDLWRMYDLDFSQLAIDFKHDLEADRYFVILKAFDFRSAWKEKHRKILWEARFSIVRPGSDFVKSLPAMAYQASRYFGDDSGGVIRRPLPDVKITYGDAKTIDIEPAK